MFFDIISYLPMYTALFWAITLLTIKEKGESAKLLLSIFMFAIFLLDLSVMFFYHHQYDIYLYADPINTFFSISTFLLFYWYVKLLTKEPQIKLKNLRLLIPGGLFALSSTIMYILMSPDERINYIHNFLFKQDTMHQTSLLITLKKIDFFLSKITFIIVVFYATIKCHQLISKYNKQIANYYSNLNKLSIDWAKYLIYGFIFVGFISILVNSFSQPYMLNADIAITAASLFFSALIFTIGLFGFKQDYNISNIESFATTAIDENENIVIKSTDDINQLADKITQLFQEKKIHRRQDLKISDISSELHTNRSYISKIINTEFHCNFMEYVNRHRIKDAINLFHQQAEASIAEISHQAGFNNPSTFTRVFKQHTGESPSIYRKKHSPSKQGH